MGSTAIHQEHSEGRGAAGRQSRYAAHATQEHKAFFELSGAQVIVLWSLMAGLLIMSFLFGFYAGRDQGLRVAFEQYSGQAARIPIVDPVASENSLKELFAEQTSTQVEDVQAAVEGGEEEATFDFSAEGKLSTGAPQSEQNAKPAKSQRPTSRSATLNAGGTQRLEVRTLTNLPAGWYIQIAATKTKAEADEITAKIAEAGHDAAIEVAEVGSQRYFRVLIGAYDSRAAAEKSRQTLAKQKLTQAVPFLKRVSK